MRRFILFMLTLLGYSFVSCEPNYEPDMYGVIPVEYSEKPLAEATLAEEANNDTQDQE